MPPPDLQRVKALFDAAVELPPERRGGFLDDACNGDEVLRAEIETLLRGFAAHGDDSFLEAPVRSHELVGAAEERAGQVIDGYRLVESIGEGSGGTVWLAEQSRPFRRRVALKLLRSEIDSAQLIRRFDAERQALAMMEHANIAKVYGCGATASGRPYFAMEYVEGLPITRYSDEHRLSVRRRLELAKELCHAVQHAHVRGIIHRDIKPSNVLVATAERPIVKVIDFGIAKATETRLTDGTLLTHANQLLGTPEYMSPEQAEMEPDVDTRTDIYSIGVVLYEMLTGTRPFEVGRLMESGYSEVLRVLREELPPRPSARIKTVGAERPQVAVVRGADATSLRRVLRNDLDWIVLKALAKDRERRYASARELALDIDRFLRHEPVTARPTSFAYRLQLRFRRNRLATIVAILFVVALITGISATVWQWREAVAHAEREARARRIADGHRLSAQAIERADREPTLALLLAIEAGKRTTGLPVHQALWKTLDRQREVAILSGHEGAITRLASSADGRWITSADTTSLQILWNAETRDLVQRWDDHAVHEGPGGMIRALGFSNDGRTVFSGAADGCVRLYDVATGRPGPVLRLPAAVTCAVFGPEGRVLHTGSDDGEVRAFDVATGRARGTIVEHRGAVRQLEVRNGVLASIGTDGAAWIVRLATAAKHRLELGGRPENGAASAKLSLGPDGTWVITKPGPCGPLVMWSTATGKPIRQLARGRECVDFAVSPDATRLYAVYSAEARRRDEDRAVHELWDLPGDRVVSRLRDTSQRIGSVPLFSRDGRWLRLCGHGGMVDALTGSKVGIRMTQKVTAHASAGGARFVTGGQDRELRVWQPSVLVEHRATSGQLALPAPDGRHGIVLATGFIKDGIPSPEHGRARHVDLTDGREIAELRPAWSKVRARGPYYSPSGRIAALAADDRFRLWDLERDELICEIGPAERVAVAPDERSVAVGWSTEWEAGRVLGPGTLRVLDLETGCDRWSRDCTSRILGLRFSSDGRYLVGALGPQRRVTIWNAATGDVVKSIDYADWCFDAAFSPDGARLAVTTNDGSTWVHATDAAGGGGDWPVRHRLTWRLGVAGSELAWSPDGRHLAVRLGRRILTVWNAETGTMEFQRDYRGGGWIRNAYFTKDGQHLAVYVSPGVLRLLPMDPLARAKAVAPRRLTAQEMEKYRIGTPAEWAERRREELAEQNTRSALAELARLAIARGDDAAARAHLRAARELRPGRPVPAEIERLEASLETSRRR